MSSFTGSIAGRSIAVLALLTFPTLAMAETVPVIVKNPTTAPVPISGSVNATIQGTPTVNANITGTPTVNIGTMPTLSATVQDPAKTASVQGGFQTFQENAGFATDNFLLAQIPAGQRYVIETVSIICSLPTGTVLTAVQLQFFVPTSPVSAVGVGFPVTMQKQGSVGGFDYYVGSLNSRIYADAIFNSVTSVTASLTVAPAINLSFTCSSGTSGYFVPLP
jgi:hypothetical protein